MKKLLLIVAMFLIAGCAPRHESQSTQQQVDSKKYPVERDKGILLYKEYHKADENDDYYNNIGIGHIRLLSTGDVKDLKINTRILNLVDTLKPNDTIYIYKWYDDSYTWTNIK